MIRYYTNRELSRLFAINLAKWKRWSREFLPPDPLGGLQSGYARQYTQDDAFTVFLGGHLVGDLRFSIPETKCILSDLSSWLGASGFYENTGTELVVSDSSGHMIDTYLIFVQFISSLSGHPNSFSYVIRNIISENTVAVNGQDVRQVQYLEKKMGPSDMHQDPDALKVIKILDISGLFRRFCSYLNKDVVIE